jgi:Protein of unknown function (DUF2934)
MATRKSTTTTEKKTTTRKAPAKRVAPAMASPVENTEKKIPTYDDIAILAEQFWNERGRPFGSPEVDWLRAEATFYAA